MTQQTLTARAWAELALLGLIWGGSFLAIRIALDEIGPLTSVLYRCGIAMAALWTVVWLRRLPVPAARGFWAAALAMGLLNNVLPFSLMAWGQLHISTGLTSILNATTAIFGVLVAAACFADERLGPRKALGVTRGIAGVVLAIGPGALRDFDASSLAQIAVLAGTLSYALAGTLARRFLRGVPPLVAAASMLTGSTLMMLPAVLVVEGPPPLALAPVTWLAVGYYALVATALAYLIYYRVLGMAGSGNLLLVTLLIPPVAIALGALVRGEMLQAGALTGFALLAAGLLVIDGRLLPRRRRQGV